MKKSVKKIISTGGEMVCPRCKIVTSHTLFDFEKNIYKCNICETIHAKK